MARALGVSQPAAIEPLAARPFRRQPAQSIKASIARWIGFGGEHSVSSLPSPAAGEQLECLAPTACGRG